MIFLSTGGERRQKGSETALQYFQNGIECIELSGGVYSPTCTSDLVALPSAIKLQVHNYFPLQKSRLYLTWLLSIQMFLRVVLIMFVKLSALLSS